MNAPTSMAHREDVIRRVVYDQQVETFDTFFSIMIVLRLGRSSFFLLFVCVWVLQVTNKQHPTLFVTCGQIKKIFLKLSNVKGSTFTSTKNECGRSK